MVSAIALGCARADGEGQVPASSANAAEVPPPELRYRPPGEGGGPANAEPRLPASETDTPERPGEVPASTNPGPARVARPDDPDEVIRRWMLGDTQAPPLPERFAGTQADGRYHADEADPWIAYLGIASDTPAERREAELRRILSGRVPEPLRQIILLDIASDLSFQSRRAGFVRRYGFYASWFNRLTYAMSRAVQGNVQATGQVLVDAVFDHVGTGEVTPAERRIYKLLRDLEREGRGTRRDRKRMEELERRINEAVAEADLEQGEFSLSQSNPDLARFYARNAHARRPESRAARRLEERAEAEMAARRRRFLASNQVGYPDRHPPFRTDSPELLRAALSRRHSDLVAQLEQHRLAMTVTSGRNGGEAPAEGPHPLDPGQEFMARLLASLPDQNQTATVAMRQWAETLREAGYAPDEETLWLKRLLQDPQFNPDLRLARAESSRRGNLAAFILIGPESNRARAYTFASRVSSAFDALASVGIFYVFEVFYRAGVVAFSPPPPKEEMLDAAAAYIEASPADASSRSVAQWLIDQYLQAGRFERARDILERYGELDRRKSEELFEMEARRAYAMASATPVGSPEREWLYRRAAEVAPGTKIAARAERKLAERKAEHGEPWEVEVPWVSIVRWFEEPAPGPFPGRPQWFDGDAANGEVAGPTVRFSGEGSDPESVLMSYAVRQSSGTEYFQEWLLLRSFPPRVGDWVRFHLVQRERLGESDGQLGRPRIPYSIVGGVGLSGVDFYPRLRPIESQTGELELYQSSP